MGTLHRAAMVTTALNEQEGALLSLNAIENESCVL